MLLSKHIQRFIRQINPAKLYHQAMYNTQCRLEKDLRNNGVENESQLKYNEVYSRAYETFMDENYEESARIFKQLKKMDGKNIHNHINYSISLQKSNKPYDALKAINKALSMMESPSSTQQNQPDNITESSSTEKIASNPFLKASAQAVKAQCLGAIGYNSEALKHYEEAAKVNSQFYLGMGNMCFEKQMYSKALSHYMKATKASQLDFNEVIINIIHTLYKLRLFKACFELSERYSFISNSEYQGMYFAGISSLMLENNNNNKVKARQYLEMAVSLAPNQFECVYELAKLLKEEGLHEEALNHLQKFMEFDCANSVIYREAGENLLLCSERNEELAKEYLEQSLLLDDKQLEVYVLLTNILTSATEKVAIIEKGLAIYPQSHQLHYLKSCVHQSLKNTPLQMRELEKCVQYMQDAIQLQSRSKRVSNQNCIMKYYNELTQLYVSCLSQTDLNQNDLNSIQSKLEQLKIKSQAYFDEIVDEQLTLSVLKRNVAVDHSSIAVYEKIFTQNVSQTVSMLIQDNQFQSIHFQLGLSFLKRDSHSQALEHFSQVKSDSLNKESLFILNFLQLNCQLGMQEYQKSLESIDSLNKFLEIETFSESLVFNLKDLTLGTNLEETLIKVSDSTQLQMLCDELKEMILNSIKIKDIFPQF